MSERSLDENLSLAEEGNIHAIHTLLELAAASSSRSLARRTFAASIAGEGPAPDARS